MTSKLSNEEIKIKKLLESYLEKLNTNTLTCDERVHLTEFYIQNNLNLPTEEYVKLLYAYYNNNRTNDNTINNLLQSYINNTENTRENLNNGQNFTEWFYSTVFTQLFF